VNKLQKIRQRYSTPKKDARKEKLCRCGALPLSLQAEQHRRNTSDLLGGHDARAHLLHGQVVGTLLRELTTNSVDESAVVLVEISQPSVL